MRGDIHKCAPGMLEVLTDLADPPGLSMMQTSYANIGASGLE